MLFSQFALFHFTPFDCSHADWHGLHHHLRHFPREGLCKLGASAAGTEFCGWVQVGIDGYILRCKYLVMPDSSP